MSNIAVQRGCVRPIRLDGNEVEPMTFHETAGDRSTSLVELGSAMARVDRLRFRFRSVFNRLFPKPKPIFTKTETESVTVSVAVLQPKNRKPKSKKHP
jgi:hypothetical protein